jgi:putative ABC transport system ATP-binding protein
VNEPVLRAENLVRDIPGRRLVDSISFAVERSELLAIAGPSGSGKTSLLRLLNRLDEPTAGSVFVDGRDFREMRPRELRRRVGMVMQRPFLFPGTVEENIRFGPEQHGETLDAAAVEDLLQRVGLGGFGNRAVDNLSGGEAQRVSLARTLANRPSVLLMDEPTSALDETLKLQIEQLILAVVNQHQLGCVVVTHDGGQAVRIASRVLRIDAGRMSALGSPAEVIGAEPAH